MFQAKSKLKGTLTGCNLRWSLPVAIALLALALLLTGEAQAGEPEVELTADITEKAAEPGETVKFEVLVNNTGNQTDTFELTLPLDSRQWAYFQATGNDTRNITLNPGQKERVWVVVALPEYTNTTGADRTALEATSYPVGAKATTSNYNSSHALNLTVDILQIYGASLTVIGEDNLISYPAAYATAGDREERFAFQLKNLGNRWDTLQLEVIAASYPSEWSVGLYSQPTGGSPIDSDSLPASTSIIVYLRVTPDQDSDTGNFTLIVQATARDGAEDPVNTTVTLDVREPLRSITLAVAEDYVTLVPEPGNDVANTARFKIVLTNTGSHDDAFIAQLENIVGPGWSAGFYTRNTGSPGDRWSSSGEQIESGRSDDLWFIVIVDPEADEGNYTLEITVKDVGEHLAQTLTFQIRLIAPIRGLTMIAVDSQKEITPVYKGSDSDNRVRFKVKLENTGTHTDKFIPEVESTLEPGWDVEFYQGAGHTIQWPANGLNINSGVVDDLWIFVVVDDTGEDDVYPITISVRDEKDHPDARAEVNLTVSVVHSDLEVKPIDISLEVNGVASNTSLLTEGDQLRVLVDVHNNGNANADGARVETYIYPQQPPQTQEHIGELEAKGFVEDEDGSTWIFKLYDWHPTIRANMTHEIISDSWRVEPGEWFVKVRLDYDYYDEKGQLLEWDESNNRATRLLVVEVAPPPPPPIDLSVAAFDLDTSASTPYPVLDLTLTVANSGTNASGPFALELALDGNVFKSYPVANLSGGEATTLTIVWVGNLTGGLHRFSATADALNEVNETDEANNNATIALWVIEQEGKPEREQTPGFAWPQLALGGAAAVVVASFRRRGRRRSGLAQ